MIDQGRTDGRLLYMLSTLGVLLSLTCTLCVMLLCSRPENGCEQINREDAPSISARLWYSNGKCATLNLFPLTNIAHTTGCFVPVTRYVRFSVFHEYIKIGQHHFLRLSQFTALIHAISDASILCRWYNVHAHNTYCSSASYIKLVTGRSRMWQQ
jgi:hypothetical protein